MKVITKEYKVYSYSELSEEAKEKAKSWYLEGQESSEFTHIYMEDLRYLFNNSELKLQYSLSYCQGDGLNIYGKLDLTDVISMIKFNKAGETLKEFENILNEKEIKTVEAYMEVCGRCIELPYNNGHYEYCVADRTEFAEDWIENLQYNMYKNIQVDTIRKLEKVIRDMFTALSGKYEEYGYSFFYEVDDETMKEVCEANEWMFLENGKYFAG